MPFFVSGREIKRLVRDVADWRQRATVAEMRLHEISLAVLDAESTRRGSYAVSTHLPKVVAPPLPETDDQFALRLREERRPIYDEYVRIARETGSARPEEDALDWIVREATGQPLPYQLVG